MPLCVGVSPAQARGGREFFGTDPQTCLFFIKYLVPIVGVHVAQYSCSMDTVLYYIGVLLQIITAYSVPVGVAIS